LGRGGSFVCGHPSCRCRRCQSPHWRGGAGRYRHNWSAAPDAPRHRTCGLPPYAQEPVGSVPTISIHPVIRQVAVGVVGRTTGCELVGVVVGVVRGGRCAASRNNLLDAVARTVKGCSDPQKLDTKVGLLILASVLAGEPTNFAQIR
jgi:hypothetical protein